MVKVVVPLRIEAKAVLRGGSDDARVVEIALRDRVDRAAQLLSALADRRGEVLQEGLGGVIDDCVYGVDAQRIDMKLVDPLQCAVDEEPSHVVALGTVEVDRQSPRRLVSIGEVRREFAE